MGDHEKSGVRAMRLEFLDLNSSLHPLGKLIICLFVYVCGKDSRKRCRQMIKYSKLKGKGGGR